MAFGGPPLVRSVLPPAGWGKVRPPLRPVPSGGTPLVSGGVAARGRGRGGVGGGGSVGPGGIRGAGG